MAKNMWGKFEELEAATLPVAYLREQAENLSEMTGRIVLGRILTGEQKGGRFVYYLDTVVPSLNNYSLGILRIEYPINIYPLRMLDMVGSKNYSCNSEEEFINDLEQILSSDKVKNAISVLYSQGKDKEKKK